LRAVAGALALTLFAAGSARACPCSDDSGSFSGLVQQDERYAAALVATSRQALGRFDAFGQYAALDARERLDLLAQIAELDEAALSDPDLYVRDPKRFAELTERIARHRADIEAAEVRWLEVAEMAEALASGSALQTSARG